MKLRSISIFLALLALAGAALLWFRELPAADVVFDTQLPLRDLSGMASGGAAPRGTKRVRLEMPNGQVLFTDCLAMTFVCSEASGVAQPVSVRARMLSSTVFWPVEVATMGRTVVSRELSRENYALYVERDGTLYRFPLALAGAFVVFAFWFGRRPAFD